MQDRLKLFLWCAVASALTLGTVIVIAVNVR
jgi:hypothetical protein